MITLTLLCITESKGEKNPKCLNTFQILCVLNNLDTILMLQYSTQHNLFKTNCARILTIYLFQYFIVFLYTASTNISTCNISNDDPSSETSASRADFSESSESSSESCSTDLSSVFSSSSASDERKKKK